MITKGLIYGDKWQLTSVESGERCFLRHIVSERIICLTKSQLEKVEKGEIDMDKLISKKIHLNDKNKYFKKTYCKKENENDTQKMDG